MDITIGWTKSKMPEYSSFTDGYRYGAEQHTETITVDAAPWLSIEAIADAVFVATNHPEPLRLEGLPGEVFTAILNTGYNGRGFHYSLSVGDTVTVGEMMVACESIGWKHMMRPLDHYVFSNFLTGGSNALVDNRRNALALRMGRQLGLYPEVLAIVKRRRREWLTWHILTQGEWKRKVSRRPQRGRHHDSWAVREAYVRADGSDYTAHLGYGHAVRADRGKAAA